jgi:beta-glucanase (GH16 family)
MPSFFNRLRFYLSGGVPKTSKFEGARASLERKYADYLSLKQTPNFLHYQSLALQVATPRRQSGLSKKERRALKREFAALRKSAEVVNFFKAQKAAHNFRQITCWKLTFDGTFKGKTLDTRKWTTLPVLPENTPDILYSSPYEYHVYTNGGNVSLLDQTLAIVTKQEPAQQGVGFDSRVGFLPVERSFTSGIVSSIEKFSQPHGKIEVRCRFNSPHRGMYHAIWLRSHKMLPHVNMLRVDGKAEFGAFAASEPSENHLHKYVDVWSRALLRQNTYYVVAVEWDKETIVWRVNGAKIFSAPNIIAGKPMHIAFSSGVTRKINTSAQAVLEVDWVKAYDYQGEVVLP